MIGYEQTSVNELREILVREGGLTPSEAESIKGKSNLVYKVMQLRGAVPSTISEDAADALEDVASSIDLEGMQAALRERLEALTPQEIEDGEARVAQPKYTDPEWESFVMS